MKKINSDVESQDIQKWVAPVEFSTDSTSCSLEGAFEDINLGNLSKQAFQNGYDTAQNDLMQQFENKFKTKIDERLASEREKVNKLVFSLQNIENIVTDEIKNALIDFTVNIAQHICRRELKGDPEALAHTITEALALMPLSDTPIKIHVNADTHHLIKDCADCTLDKQPITIMVDDSLSDSDFIVENNFAKIDASINQRLAQLVDELK